MKYVSLAACLTVTLLSTSWPATYYVSTTGSDTADGSQGNPWKTLNKATVSVSAGDLVMVAGGTYRELFKPRGGSEGSPVTYWTDPTDRAVISGGEIIDSSWTRCTQDDCPDNSAYNRIYYTDLNEEPDGIYEDGIELEVAASKDWGFWEIESAASNYELVDTSHLTGPDDYWVGAQVHYWPVAGSGRRIYAYILDYEAAAHKLSMEHAPFDHFRDYIKAGESYRLENHISLLSRPGDYVLDRTVSPGKIRLYIWSYNSDDPAGHTYETKARLTCISLDRVKNAVFHGFEVRFTTRKCIYGIQVKNIEIENSFVHDNGTGIDISGSDIWVKKSVFTRQGTSINLKAGNVWIDSCHIFRSFKDGIQFSRLKNGHIWNSFIHDQLGKGYPDCVQFIKGVDGFSIKNSVLNHGGQGLMTSGAVNGEVSGCLLAGTGGSELITGTDWTITNNTLWDCGNNNLRVPSGIVVIKNNIVTASSNKCLSGSRNVTSYTADYNIYNKGKIDYMGRSYSDFEAYRFACGQEAHSYYTDPQFVNAPVSYHKNASKGYHRNTPSKLYLNNVSGIEKGDKIEVHWDNVLRTVTAVNAGESSVEFTPPTPNPLVTSISVVNWKNAVSTLKDFRLKSTSPGYRAGEDGNDIGASIDLQAWRNRDWDEDGLIDLVGNTGGGGRASVR